MLSLRLLLCSEALANQWTHSLFYDLFFKREFWWQKVSYLLCIHVYMCVFCFLDDLLYSVWDGTFWVWPLFCPCPPVMTGEGIYFLKFCSCRKPYLLLEFKLLSFIQMSHTSVCWPFPPLNSRPVYTSIYWTSPLYYLTASSCSACPNYSTSLPL